MREIELFLGKIYTAGKNFTRPLVATVATNLNSDDAYISLSVPTYFDIHFLQTFMYLSYDLCSSPGDA